MTRPWLLGLTGSIGMGKSTTAAMFRDLQIPVWDADAAVMQAYGPGGAAVPAVVSLCPEVVVDGAVDRARLRAWVAADPGRIAALEAFVHPIVTADRTAFVAAARRAGARLVVLDIPLLFETGAEAACDSVLVVTAPADLQRARVMARPGMTAELFAILLARQMPDADKRARADHVIETRTMDGTRAAVAALAAELGGRADA
jgi:dephospho-CoA kinase